ncbi:MAG TPA: hypothetical protein VGD17_09035 [Chitinophagaceae bacterium]
MKKQSIIQTFLIAVVITLAVFVVAAARTNTPLASQDECLQEKVECPESETQSEFLLESLTRNLLGR